MPGGEGHSAILSELSAGLPLPHVIAARARHACGTLTMTGARLARTAKPAFSPYGQRSPGVRTTCGMYAGGTEITPRTRRYPPAKGDFGWRMIWSHVTTSGYAAADGVETAGCDEPPRHDTDTDPANTTTTSTLALDPTVRSYARESSVAEPVHGDTGRARHRVCAGSG